MKRSTKSWIIAFFAVLVLASVASVLVIRRGWGGWFAWGLSGANPFTYMPETHTAVRASHIAGESVVAALERWRAKNGSYPANLAMLVPSEIPSIPPPIVGDGIWKYELHGNLFFLEFWVGPDYESDTWRSGGKEWYTNR